MNLYLTNAAESSGLLGDREALVVPQDPPVTERLIIVKLLNPLCEAHAEYHNLLSYVTESSFPGLIREAIVWDKQSVYTHTD